MEIDVANLALDGDDHGDMFPLLDRLLEDVPEVLERFLLPALDTTTLALLARVPGKELARGRGVIGPAARGVHREGATKGGGVLRVYRSTRIPRLKQTAARPGGIVKRVHVPLGGRSRY
jgi:hypothetical protein